MKDSVVYITEISVRNTPVFVSVWRNTDKQTFQTVRIRIEDPLLFRYVRICVSWATKHAMG